MKTISKVAALAMTLSLACVLSACGGNASSSSAASSASSSDASSASAASSVASASASTASSTSQMTTYSNDYFGLDYVLPEGWSFTDAAALANTNSAIASAAGSDAIEMVAASADKSTSVIVALIEPSAETSGMTAENLLESQTKQMQSSLEGTHTYSTVDGDISFDGMDRKLPANFTTITEGNTTLVIGQAVAEKNGIFLDVLAVGMNEADVDNAFKAFKATAE